MDAPSRLLAPAPRTDPIAVPGRDPIPVTLLTGFLGAGKTTLLNRILVGDHGLRVGVLVNDFGAVNIDAALVESVEDNVYSLANGCVCCEIRDDLVESLEQLVSRTDELDHIILEASGVADPAGIVMTFLDARYEQLLRIDSVTCVVDAEGIFAQDHDEKLTMLKLRQIGFADLVVLNKTDLVGPDHLEVIRDWIGLHFQRIRIVEAVQGGVPLEVLLAVGRFDPAKAAELGRGDADHRVGGAFDRWSFRTHQPFSHGALEQMIRRNLPASVYRCKGIIFTDDDPDRPRALQVVGRRTQLVELDRRPGRGGPSDIVAIGQGIDPDELDDLFNSCLAAAERPVAPPDGPLTT